MDVKRYGRPNVACQNGHHLWSSAFVKDCARNCSSNFTRSPKNKDWERRHDFIYALFHATKQENPDLTYDTGAVIIFEEFFSLKLEDEFNEIKIKKVLQRKYEDYALDRK